MVASQKIIRRNVHRATPATPNEPLRSTGQPIRAAITTPTPPPAHTATLRSPAQPTRAATTLTPSPTHTTTLQSLAQPTRVAPTTHTPPPAHTASLRYSTQPTRAAPPTLTPPTAHTAALRSSVQPTRAAPPTLTPPPAHTAALRYSAQPNRVAPTTPTLPPIHTATLRYPAQSTRDAPTNPTPPPAHTSTLRDPAQLTRAAPRTPTPQPSPTASLQSPAEPTRAAPLAGRRRRGPARGIATSKALKASKSGKLSVIIQKKVLAAVGQNSDKFSSEVGVLTRQNAPLTAKFELEDTPIMRRMILAMANASYRTWRSRLHGHYKLFETDEERLEHPPSNVLEEEWEHLVYYFGTSKFQESSSRNKKSRTKHVVPHTVGRQSFAAVSYENADITSLINQSLEGENHLTPDEAFIEVMGEKACMRYGLKPKGSKLRMQAQLDEVTQQHDEFVKEIVELKEQVQDQHTQHAEEIATLKAQVEAQNITIDFILAQVQTRNV
ncbi:hypothetical protein ACFE04_003661 [Oxalis oulophora]